MESTKDRIISAAIELFAANGYTETSMKAIATMVEIKQSSIYNHFTSKLEIFETIMNMYREYTVDHTVSLEEIDKLIRTESALSILRRMYYVFDPENAYHYSKILKIILHEQFRELHAQDFVKNYMFIRNQQYTKVALDKLAAAGKIKPIDTGVYAKLLNSLDFASATEAMFYTIDEYQNMPGRVRRQNVLEFLFHEIIGEE